MRNKSIEKASFVECNVMKLILLLLLSYQKMNQANLDFQAIRIGNKQRLMCQNISSFSLLKIKRVSPALPFYAIMINTQQIYLTDHQFSITHKHQKTAQSLLSLAYLKVHLRHDYKLPCPLHMKMRYSFNHQCIFILLQDGSIAVFNYDMYLLDNIKLGSFQRKNYNLKYCIDYDYHQIKSKSFRQVKNCYFILLFSDNIEIFEFQILTNHKLSKYKSSFQFTLTPVSRSIIDNGISHPITLNLVNGVEELIRLQQNIQIKKVLVCNCSKQIYFYLLADDISEVIRRFQINKKNDFGIYITDYEINMNLNKIYISLSHGVIETYSYKEQLFGKLLSTIKVCTSSILSTYLLNQKKMYCYSEDAHLYLINLQTFSIEHKYNLGLFDRLQYISQNTFLGVGYSLNNAYIDINPRHKDTKCLIMNIFNAKYINMVGYSSDIVNYNITERSSLILFSDNSIIYQPYVDRKHLKEYSTYLPPTTVTVKCLMINPFHVGEDYEEYWILTDKSFIYKYKFSSFAAPKVIGILELNKFYDNENLELRLCVNYFIFLKKIVYMEYDSQKTTNNINKTPTQRQQNQQLCLGTITGQILIVSLNNVSTIICRLKFLSKPITFIYELFIYNECNDNKGLLVYGSQSANRWFITEIQENEIPIQRYRLTKDKVVFKLMNSHIMALINDNTFNLCYFSSNTQTQQGNICMYTQQHYSPVLIPNSTIQTLTYLQQDQSIFIISGYSYGEILIYKLCVNKTQKAVDLQLSLCYVIQNSNLTSVQYVCYRYGRLMFGLGKMIVEYKLPRVQEQTLMSKNQGNVRIDNVNRFIQELSNKGQAAESQLKRNKSAKNQRKARPKTLEKKQSKQILMLPKIKQSPKVQKKRSASYNSIHNNKKKQHSDYFFHFPDIFLYRNLIQKNIIS